jgi:hypothetical protein
MPTDYFDERAAELTGEGGALERPTNTRLGAPRIGLDPNEAAVDDAASFPNPGTWSELKDAADAAARIAGPFAETRVTLSVEVRRRSELRDALVSVREFAKACRASGGKARRP